MKFFNWMQSKFNGVQGSKIPNVFPPFISHHTKKEAPKEEFNDWPHGLLAIGTFGINTNLGGKQVIIQETEEEEECSSPDFSEFTAEEIGKLHKELTKILRRKPSSKADQESIADLPLERFLNCPSSLEVDRTISNRFSINSDGIDEIDRTIKIILGRCKDVCEKKNETIPKKSISFLFKKMFSCRSVIALTPSLRDNCQESRMEKLLRKMLAKKMPPEYSSKNSSKMYLENNGPTSKAEVYEEQKDKSHERSSKWVKTDSEYIVLEI